jgi:putative two-component system response regulator
MSSTNIERLESLLRSVARATSADLRSALDSIYGELVSRGSRSSVQSMDFFLGALQVLRKIKGVGNAQVRLLCLHKCSIYFFQHGRSDAALDSADILEQLALQTRSLQALRQATSVKGVIYADFGNIPEALAQHTRALEVAREMGDAENEAVVLNNLGIALNYAGLHREAAACLLKVIAVARPEWKLSVEKKALSNLAQSYLAIEEFPRALEAMQRCMALRSLPMDANARMDHTICEFTFTQVALEMNDSALARKHAELCAVHGYAANSIRCRIMADIAQARCDVRDGNVRQGLAALEQAYIESRELDSSHSDALIAMVKAYDEINQPEFALKHLNHLLAHVHKNRAGSIQNLLAMVGGTSTELESSTDPGLQALEHRLSGLRARVAQREVADSRMEMLERLGAIADLREDSSGEHGYRVGSLSALLARDLGWTAEAAAELERAARLHDLGKIGIPERILGSSQSLREAERELMRMHTLIGAELLAKSNVPELMMAAEIAHHHHEWWNGSGYPHRLSGKRTPIHARIVALADVFDALTHGRPFAAPWTVEHALQQIRDCRGTQFDPELTDRFVDLVERLRADRVDLDAHLGKAGLKSPFLQARNRIRELLEEARERELHLLH